jgi:hypothetical protein
MWKKNSEARVSETALQWHDTSIVVAPPVEIQDERSVRGSVAREGDLPCTTVYECRLNFRKWKILDAICIQ